MERLDPLRSAAVAVDLLQVEEERLDHVLRHLAGDEVHEVAALDLQRVVEVDLGALDRGGHDVVRGGVVGALELLAQVGRERRQVLSQRRRRRCPARDLVALHVPWLDRLGIGLDPRARGRDQVVTRRDDLVDHAELQRLGGPQALALQQQRHQRVDDAEHPHAAHDAAGAREQAELHLGEADDRLGVVDDHAVVAGQADLQAAAERRPVDRRHHRLAERLQAAQQRLAVADEPGHLLGVVLRGLAQVVQVAAGEERVLRGGDDHARDLVLGGLEAVDRRGHRRGVGRVHRVGGLLRVIEREQDDAVVAALVADRVAHQRASTTVAMPMPPPTHSVASP